MSKPDWKDAPEWANWAAAGEEGFWHWYADKPVFCETTGEWDGEEIRLCRPCIQPLTTDEARGTLEERSRG